MRVVVQGLSKYYGNITAVSSVSFDIASGEFVALRGASGSGKTTVLRLLAGFLLPDAGSIALDGVTVSDRHNLCPPHQRQIGFVFQQPTLWPHMTVWQHLTFSARGPQAPAEARLTGLLTDMGLADLRQRYPAELSGGQARRVGVARALAASPRLLLMDEPFTNLDAAAKAELMAVTQAEIARLGCTVLYVTHDLDEIAGCASRVLQMTEGVLVAQ